MSTTTTAIQLPLVPHPSPSYVSLSVCLFVGCCTLVVKQVEVEDEVEDEDEVGSGGPGAATTAAEPVKPAKLQKLVLPASGVTAKSPVPKQFRYMGREVTKFFPEATTLAGLAHLDDKYVVRAFLDFCRSKSNGESYARVFQVGASPWMPFAAPSGLCLGTTRSCCR